MLPHNQNSVFKAEDNIELTRFFSEILWAIKFLTKKKIKKETLHKILHMCETQDAQPAVPV